MAQTVKNLPTMQETWVQSLGWEVPLAKGMAIHSSILAWRIPRAEEPGGPQSMGSQKELDMTEATSVACTCAHKVMANVSHSPFWTHVHPSDLLRIMDEFCL